MACDVFEEAPAKGWAKFSDDPGNVVPEPPRVFIEVALSCEAFRLAGVSGKQGVEGAGEGASIEGGDIVPDRGVGQVSSALGGNEDGPRVCLPFDVAAGMEVWLGETEAQIQPAASCAEGESVKGTWHHVMPPPVS